MGQSFWLVGTLLETPFDHDTPLDAKKKNIAIKSPMPSVDSRIVIVVFDRNISGRNQ